MEIVAVLVFFLLLAAGVSMAVVNEERTMEGDDLRILPLAQEEFRNLVVHHELPELCFDGRTAEIVDERQEGGYVRGSSSFILQSVSRFARNAHGEYFFFMSEGTGKPIFKHVSQSSAKLELGKKYLPPP